jgi:rubrerythrin
VSNLKPGETVKIYEDPWTQKKLEGEAKLIERLQEESDREYWLVEFTDSHERHPRWIKKLAVGPISEAERARARELHFRGPQELPKDWGKTARSSLCQRLQDFIDEEQKAVDEYEELWKELDRLGQKGYATGIIRIAEEERSHRDTLKRIKEVMCP